jgi:hypothetical protein
MTKALAFFTEAAARNSPDGHFNAANMYYHGLATARDLPRVRSPCAACSAPQRTECCEACVIPLLRCHTRP